MTLELHETAAIRAVLRDDWDALRPRLLAIAQRVVRRREVAEDVVSATVIELIGRVDAGEEIRDPGAYLARGVRFRAIDVVRSKDGQAVVGTEVADDALASIADTRLGAMAVDDLDALAPVREAFGALAPRHREVLARTVIHDEPVKDVAGDMGMSPNAVAVLALRARRALRTELQAVLMERMGGACAEHARSKDRAPLAHVADCGHCLEVRGGRGFGRWVFAVVPLLVGGGAVAASPATMAQAVVGTIVRKPAIAATAAVGVVAAATVVVVASVAAFTPAEGPSVAPPVSQSTAAQPPAAASQDEAAPVAEPTSAPVAVEVETVVGPGTAAPVALAPGQMPVRVAPAATPLASAPATPEPPVVTPADAAPPATTPAPAPVDPAPVDPAPVDPAPVDPAPVDPAPVDPTPVDPAPVDPAPVDPTPVDPAPVDPTPVDLEPAVPDPTLALVGPPPVWSTTLPLLASTTFAIDGLVQGAAYRLAAPGSLLVGTTVTGMTCAAGLCTADGTVATFAVRALDLILLCSAPQSVTLTPQTTEQVPVTVTVPALGGPVCLTQPEVPGIPELPQVPGSPELPQVPDSPEPPEVPALPNP